MIRAYKYRIFPTPCQQQQLAQYFGCARLVFNRALESRNIARESGLKFPSYRNLANELPSLTGQYPFLRVCPSQSLQQSIKNQTTAFENFFEGRADHPNFKSKYDRQSIQLPQGVSVNVDDGTLFIPKLKIVSCKFHRTFQGKIKTVTVSKTPSGSYYASILVESQDQVPAKRPVSKELTIGMDMGIKSLAKFSNGQTIDNPKWLSAKLATLRRLQRSVSRKKKGREQPKKGQTAGSQMP
jgi:putative transposase